MSQLSTLPLMEMEGEQDQRLFPAAFHVAKDPPILFPFMITNPVDQLQGQSSYGDQHLRQHVLSESTQQFTDRMMMSGSEVFPTRPSPFRQTIQSIDGDMTQRSAYDPYDIENNKHIEGLRSGGWTVSSSPPAAKMKITRRKATSEYPEGGGGAARKPRRRPQAHQDESQLLQHQQHAMGVVRVCSDCNTTKTPLWRSGPCGPKSLCNACGIRQRKARRAMAAAAAAAASDGGAPQAATQQPKPAKKEKRSDVDRSSLPFKKRCKMVVVDHAAGGAATEEATTTPETAAPTKDQADHHVSSDKQVNGHAATSLQSKIVATPPQPMSSFHAFPADEITDAAMLLMTLSCGLARPQLAMASS
ncbi:protein CYTOKININ-RESPONSIVE GATA TRANSCRIPTION FACTOR 1-like [Miscanthus floridulus]|uniref:protein CYTOKININ-RESPONSIVE GATA TRANSCRIPTION FACTOR 1-like n=1 Tax=Miscanthus floridulus TaxID=154761 RepID=UPI003457A167